jgi:hypothetical protein
MQLSAEYIQRVVLIVSAILFETTESAPRSIGGSRHGGVVRDHTSALVTWPLHAFAHCLGLVIEPESSID